MLQKMRRRVGSSIGAELDHSLVRLLHDSACLRVGNGLRCLLQRWEQPWEEDCGVVRVVYHLRVHIGDQISKR